MEMQNAHKRAEYQSIKKIGKFDITCIYMYVYVHMHPFLVYMCMYTPLLTVNVAYCSVLS